MDIVSPVIPAEAQQIETGSVLVDGIKTFFRRTEGEGPPALLVHGVPTHSEDWVEVMEAMSGPAIALDLPGFGRTERPPPGRFDYSMHAQADFVWRFLDQMGVEEYSLGVHDWGALALIAAQREPSRVRRLGVVNAVPLLPGYRWHRTARMWRTPVLGELSNRIWSRRALDLALRESRGDWSRHSPEFVDMIWDHLDRGTFDAILRLYRSADPDVLERSGRDLGTLECPALVVWGTPDRYLPTRFARAYADALPNAELLEIDGAGHWPWRGQPSLIPQIARFLQA